MPVCPWLKPRFEKSAKLRMCECEYMGIVFGCVVDYLTKVLCNIKIYIYIYSATTSIDLISPLSEKKNKNSTTAQD